MRDSSPPDAVSATLPHVPPGLGATSRRTSSAPFDARLARLDAHVDARIGHAQVGQLALDRPRELRAGRAAGRGQVVGRLADRDRGRGLGLAQAHQFGVAAAEPVEPVASLVRGLQRALDRAVAAGQVVEQLQPRLDAARAGRDRDSTPAA